MKWDADFLGHTLQRRWFETAVVQGRLASTFLFVGPSGCGKQTLARRLSKLLLCLRRSAHDLEYCGTCESCVQFDAATHPDFSSISKPPDRAALPMELLVGPPENRMREGLCHQLHIRPFHGKRRIAVVDDADTIQAEGANSMLKTLEEPPAGCLIFLIGSNEQRQLPTIRSRSQIVRFQGLGRSDLLTLMKRNVESSFDESVMLDVVGSAHGSLTRAILLLDEDVRGLRHELIQSLEARPIPFIKVAKTLNSSLQSLGDNSQAKRDRMRLIFDFAVEYFQKRLRAGWLSDTDRSIEVRHQVDSELRLRQALEHCLAAQNDVERNATPAGLVEAWAAELSAILGA
jgi:DNA polymerase-3 subunit delta'